MKLKDKYQIGEVSDITITLLGSNPPVVRRIEVLSEIDLYELHLSIQHAMGWSNSHLFQFDRGDLKLGVIFQEDGNEFPDLIEALGVPVAGVLKRSGQTLSYIYDFGDFWQHKVQLNKHLERDPLQKYPYCIDGEGNCPPEDCGGIQGYYDMLNILNDPQHPEHKDIKRWLGKKFDPDKFEISRINMRLKRVKANWKEYSHKYYMKKYIRF